MFMRKNTNLTEHWNIELMLELIANRHMIEPFEDE